MADKYVSTHTGQEIDSAITKALNPSTTFTSEDAGKLADAKAVGELVNTEKERAEGVYAKTEALENGTIVPAKALLADNFDTKMVLNDKSAFNFRPTATMGSMELEVGSPCKVKGVVGGSIGWNQIIPDISIRVISSEAYIWSQLAGAFFAVETNHVYLAVLNGKTVEGGAIRFRNIKDDWLYDGGTGYYCIYKSEHTSVNTVLQGCWREGDTDAYQNVYDLTAMFGSTIADYIYSLEQANAGDGVAWFKRYFPKDYYPYKAIDGSLVHVRTSGKKYTKLNQFDITTKTDNSLIAWVTGLIAYERKSIASDYIKVVPGQTYYCNYKTQWAFYDDNKNYIGAYNNTDTPVKNAGVETNTCNIPHLYNIAYVRLGIRTGSNGMADMTTKTDINFGFHYDGERDGEYEAHESTYIPMDDGELIGIPYLDENGNLCFDGNVYNPDGSVDESKGIVDLGRLTWTYTSGSPSYFRSSVISAMKAGEILVKSNIFSSIYETIVTQSILSLTSDKTMFSWSDKTLFIRNDSYTDAATFKTAMSGVYLVYEKETATAGTARAPYAEAQPDDNWGTEEFLPPVSDTRPVEVPVGHNTDYLPDYKAKAEVAADMPGEDGYYVLKHDESNENNANQFVPASEITTPVNDKISANQDACGGTLRLLLSVSRSIDFSNTAYVDMGNLDWSVVEENAYANCQSMSLSSAIKIDTSADYIYSTKYKAHSSAGAGSGEDMQIYISSAGGVRVNDFALNGKTAAQIKDAMKGILLAYEKAST